MASYDALRREARTVENEVEQYVQAFAKLCAAGDLPDGPFDEENGLFTSEEGQLCRDTEEAISKFLSVTDAMSRCVSRSTTKAQTASIMRNREILQDFQTEFRKLRAGLVRKRESAQLFRRMDGHDASDARSMEPLLRERSGLQSAHRSIDSVLGQAADTKSTLEAQRRSMMGSSNTLAAIGSRFPTIGRLIDNVQKKKLRENVVLAVVIAFCICFTLWYLFR